MCKKTKSYPNVNANAEFFSIPEAILSICFCWTLNKFNIYVCLENSSVNWGPFVDIILREKRKITPLRISPVSRPSVSVIDSRDFCISSRKDNILEQNKKMTIFFRWWQRGCCKSSLLHFFNPTRHPTRLFLVRSTEFKRVQFSSLLFSTSLRSRQMKHKRFETSSWIVFVVGILWIIA